MRSVVALMVAACSSAESAPTPGVTPPHAPVRQLGDATATARVVGAQVVAAVECVPAGVRDSTYAGGRACEREAASDRPVHARVDQKITLYAVLRADDGRVYSDAPALVLGGKRVVPRPIAQAPRVELAWNRIEPAVANMTNGDTPAEFHFAEIEYRATAIEGAAGPALAADVRPTLTPDHGHGVGTMRYQLVVRQGDRTIASAGVDARRGRGAGGLTDAVLRVSIRRDDTFLGYLTEMFNQPYIWASAGLSDATHQSEHLEGSDCADLMVYGQRRLGKRVAYTWTGGLPKVTSLIAAGARGTDGIYRDPAGKPLPFPRLGDLVLFPRHVGALAADRGELGVLDDRDLVIHTLFDSPKEQAIADTGYADQPLEVRRFR
jgi:hypothetical protein